MDWLIITLLIVVLIVSIFSIVRSVVITKNSAKKEQEINRIQIDMLKDQHKNQLEAIERRHREQIDVLKQEYENRQEKLQKETQVQFENLASKILQTNANSLKTANSEQIEAVLRPLKENIENFRKAVNDSYVKENASRQSLVDQITRLVQLNETIGKEARNLTTALKGNSKTQGDWGEMILETLLENAGLEKDINFRIQPTRDGSGEIYKSEQGKSLRPDVLIMLPDEHCVVVDSKVSLTAFVDYCNAEDEQSKAEAGRRHLQSVMKHIDELSEKKYQDVIKGAAEQVMMFIPNESAYITALQLDINLWKYAYDRRVVMVSPTHLFSVMSIVSQMWRQEKQNQNAMKIAERGSLLYEKFVGFADSFLKVGKSIEDAQKSYEKSLGQLKNGRGNLVWQAEELKRMGVKATKKIPTQFLEATEYLLEE